MRSRNKWTFGSALAVCLAAAMLTILFSGCANLPIPGLKKPQTSAVTSTAATTAASTTASAAHTTTTASALVTATTSAAPQTSQTAAQTKTTVQTTTAAAVQTSAASTSAVRTSSALQPWKHSPEERRKLTQKELDRLTESLDYSENGFFVTSYSRPEEIRWDEVFYNGAGIAVEPTDKQLAEYVKYEGEVMTSMVCVPFADAEEFVRAHTGTEYAAARRPLTWYLAEGDLFMTQHGDTNMQPIRFVAGFVQGNEYELFYTRSDGENYMGERTFLLRARIEDGVWLYLSNWPADSEMPLTLLDIRYAEDKDEARALGASEFVAAEQLDSDDPTCWRWAVLTAAEDDVRYTVDREALDSWMEEILDMEYQTRIPGDNICSGVLQKGESVAVWVNTPWYPRIRVMATKDLYYGEFWFGEDNWLHLDPAEPRYVTGHDWDGEGKGCGYETETELANFLMNGVWVYLDPETCEVTAGVHFLDYRGMEIFDGENFYAIRIEYDHLETDEDEAPDLLCLEKAFHVDPNWDVLPSWYTWNELGDYTISAVQMDGEQILTLHQANNGEAALGYLFPDAGENQHDFILTRYTGTDIFEGQG